MKTELLTVAKLDDFSKNELEKAAKIIKNGGLVVFPTETVYGLGADATNESAANKIYEAKGRPSDNPLIIHIDNPQMAEAYAYTNELYYQLAERFMPGPLTVVLKAKSTVPKATRGGLDTVAVRCPENPIARELIKRAGVPIAAPSANLSGSPSPTNVKHVIDDMMGRVDLIIDGGDSDFGLESTIVKLDDDGGLTLLRPGKITPQDLKEVVKDVRVASAVTEELKEGETAISPGMKYRHYAPKASVVLLEGAKSACVKYIKDENLKNVAIICYDSDFEFFSSEFDNAEIYNFGNEEKYEEQAHVLFSILREADKRNFDKIYAPLPKTDGVGLALYNRMIRAAAYKIIRL